MKKFIFILLFSIFSGLAGQFSIPAYAAGVYGAAVGGPCQAVYGGGEVCVQKGNIAVNKMVLNPQTHTFTDNLEIKDPRHNPDQIVTFQITVTNTGKSKLSKVEVKDNFPQFVNFVSGPGSFDSNNKTLTFNVNDLNPNESRNFKIIGKVVTVDKLNVDGIVCVVNQSTARADEQISQDNAQFCLEKNIAVTKGGQLVFPAPKVDITPTTGPEMIPLLALLPTGIAGFLLRRRTRQ